MSKWRVKWKGDEEAKRVRAASVVGINKTMSECVHQAKSTVRVRTAALQGSLRLEPAQETASGAKGTWGSFDINYALWQEVLPDPRGRAYLRPSADANYPHLAGHVKAAL